LAYEESNAWLVAQAASSDLLETTSGRTENAVYSCPHHLSSQFTTLLAKNTVSLTEETVFLMSPIMTFALRGQEQAAFSHLHCC